MTQTTDQTSWTDADVFFQVDGDASPTEMSGLAVGVEVGGMETQVGEAYTGDSNYAILTSGKISPGEVTVKAVYTENETDAFKKLYDALIAKKRVKFLWYPQGKAVGNYEFDSGYGSLVKCTPPGGEYGSADATLFEAQIKTPSITRNTVAS